MKFRPLGNRVLVKRFIGENKTNQGIIIPEITNEKSNEGVIVAIGEGNRNKKGELISMNVKVGDHIMYTKWSGTEINIGKEKYLIIKESDILGIIKK